MVAAARFAANAERKSIGLENKLRDSRAAPNPCSPTSSTSYLKLPPAGPMALRSPTLGDAVRHHGYHRMAPPLRGR